MLMISAMSSKQGGENAVWTPNRGRQVSVMAKENLMLATFLIHHRWRCIYDCEVTKVLEDAIHNLAKQRKLENEDCDQDVLPKVDKVHMEGTIEVIEKYLR